MGIAAFLVLEPSLHVNISGPIQNNGNRCWGEWKKTPDWLQTVDLDVSRTLKGYCSLDEGVLGIREGLRGRSVHIVKSWKSFSSGIRCHGLSTVGWQCVSFLCSLDGLWGLQVMQLDLLKQVFFLWKRTKTRNKAICGLGHGRAGSQKSSPEV